MESVVWDMSALLPENVHTPRLIADIEELLKEACDGVQYADFTVDEKRTRRLSIMIKDLSAAEHKHTALSKLIGDHQHDAPTEIMPASTPLIDLKAAITLAQGDAQAISAMRTYLSAVEIK